MKKPVPGALFFTKTMLCLIDKNNNGFILKKNVILMLYKIKDSASMRLNLKEKIDPNWDCWFLYDNILLYGHFVNANNDNQFDFFLEELTEENIERVYNDKESNFN